MKGNESTEYRLPLPSEDEEIKDAWRKAMISAIKQCNEMFKDIKEWLVKPFHAAYYMNIILFVFGLVCFTISLITSLARGLSVFGLAFGGLGTITVVAIFLKNPISKMERYVVLVTWLGLVYNTYWTRLTYETDTDKFRYEAQDACNQATQSLSQLLDRICDHDKAATTTALEPSTLPVAALPQVYTYEFEGTDEKIKGKAWALIGNDDKFTTDESKTKIIELNDGQYLDIVLNLQRDRTKEIELIDFRLHNISCPDIFYGTCTGKFECYISELQKEGEFGERKRIVPTTGTVGGTPPPYYTLLPSSRICDWGTFAIFVIDDKKVKDMILSSKCRISFRWMSDSKNRRLRARSFEIYVVYR